MEGFKKFHKRSQKAFLKSVPKNLYWFTGKLWTFKASNAALWMQIYQPLFDDRDKVMTIPQIKH